jgi:hypothetical protein
MFRCYIICCIICCNTLEATPARGRRRSRQPRPTASGRRTLARCRSTARTARARNRRFGMLSAQRAHTKAPYKRGLLCETLRALNRPGGRARAVLKSQRSLPNFCRSQTLSGSSIAAACSSSSADTRPTPGSSTCRMYCRYLAARGRRRRRHGWYRRRTGRMLYCQSGTGCKRCTAAHGVGPAPGGEIAAWVVRGQLEHGLQRAMTRSNTMSFRGTFGHSSKRVTRRCRTCGSSATNGLSMLETASTFCQHVPQNHAVQGVGRNLRALRVDRAI